MAKVIDFPRQSAVQEYQQLASLREANFQLAQTEFLAICRYLGIVISLEKMQQDPGCFFDALCNLRDSNQLTSERLAILNKKVISLMKYLRNISWSQKNMNHLLSIDDGSTDKTEEIFERGSLGFLLDYAVFTVFPHFLNAEVR